MAAFRYFLIPILILIPILSFSQWQKAVGPFGDITAENFVSDDNYIYTSFYQKGVFRSADYGNEWEEVNNGLDKDYVNCLFVSDGKIYAGTKSGFFYSVNSGGNWIRDNSGLTDSTINSIGKLNDIIYIATNAGVYVQSVSGPVSWLPANNGIASDYANCFINKNEFIIAGTYKGLFRKSSSDSAWTEINNGIDSDTKILSLHVFDSKIFAGTQNNGIYESNDDGLNWNQIILPAENLNVYDFASDGSNVFAVSDSGVWISQDKGETWMYGNSGLPNHGNDAINIISYNNRLFVSIRAADIYISDNNGTLWTDLNVNLFESILIDIKSGNDKIYAASFFSGLFVKNNNDWQWLNKDYPLSKSNCILFDDDKLLFGNIDGLHTYNISSSKWELHNKGFDDSFDNINLISLTRAGNYYYAGTGRVGFYKTHIDSFVWSKIETPFPDNNELVALASVDTVIYAVLNYNCLKTLDYGHTFDYAADNLEIYTEKLSVYGNDLYAYGFSGVFYIPDNSGKWIDISYNLSEKHVRYFVLHEEGAFLSTDESVFWKSSNDTTWNDITAGIPEFESYYSIDGKYPLAIKGDSIYVGTETHGVWFADISEFSTAVKASNTAINESFELMQNYPNPFNPSTNIQFKIPEAGKIKLSVFDYLGREIDVLADGFFTAGIHNIKFEARNLASGVYIYKLTAGKYSAANKLILLK